jgi:predicted nucleic acid-binding protein
VLIEIERGRPALTLALLPSDSLVAAISVAELRAGALLADTVRRRTARIDFSEDLQRLVVIVPFGMAEANAFADAYAQLRRASTMIGERDLQIAATALANGHSVLTRNIREFSQVTGLSVVQPGW